MRRSNWILHAGAPRQFSFGSQWTNAKDGALDNFSWVKAPFDGSQAMKQKLLP
jgi:hypothetical protein